MRHIYLRLAQFVAEGREQSDSTPMLEHPQADLVPNGDDRVGFTGSSSSPFLGDRSYASGRAGRGRASNFVGGPEAQHSCTSPPTKGKFPAQNPNLWFEAASEVIEGAGRFFGRRIAVDVKPSERLYSVGPGDLPRPELST
jgi:hypothetical protein